MKHWLSVALFLTLGACAGNPAPEPPSTGPWDFSLSVSAPSGQLLTSASVTVSPYEKTTNDFGWAYFTLSTGCYHVRVEKAEFVPYTSGDCIPVTRHKRLAVTLVPVAPPTPQLEAQGQIFTQEGQPWRWKGVTAFKLQHRFCAGEDITPFLTAYAGFTLLRVFLYVEWEGTGWPVASDECIHRFLTYVGGHGFYVEETLLTGPMALDAAQTLVTHVFDTFATHTNLLVELVNEPGVHDKVDPAQLQIPSTPLLWTDGYTTAQHRGLYLTPHTARDGEWPRHAHDLLEYWHGGGPATPQDPAWHQPATGDEPAKLQDVGGCVPADWEGYFGAASLLGGGATFHSETGKYANLPTPEEAPCVAAALRALSFYPPDAPLGPYSRIDEQGQTLRTYKVGPYTVRIRPVSGPTLVPWP